MTEIKNRQNSKSLRFKESAKKKIHPKFSFHLNYFFATELKNFNYSGFFRPFSAIDHLQQAEVWIAIG
jgi:hypothetical protein